MHRKGTSTPALGLDARTPVLGLTTHTCLQARHPHISQPPSGPLQPQPPQAKGSHTTILGRDTHALTPIQRPAWCRPWHPHTHPRAPSLTQTRLHTPWPSAAASSCRPSPTGSPGAPIPSTTGLGGLRPGQAVGPQRGLSAIFPARAAHLPRSHQPALRPARRHCPSSPTARCAPAPGGSRPPLPPQPALHVLGLRR